MSIETNNKTSMDTIRSWLKMKNTSSATLIETYKLPD